MEMIDILDENGVKTGEVASRQEVHRLGLWHRVVAVAVINERGELLVQQRSADKEKNANLWDISVAGHISTGQDSLSAATREINEEIGVYLDREIKVRDFCYLTCFRNERVYHQEHGDFIERQYYDCFALYMKGLTEEDLKLQEEEVQAAKFVTVEDLQVLIESGQMVDRREIWPVLLAKISGGGGVLEEWSICI